MQHKKGCSLRPKTQEVIRTPQEMPVVGEWYVVSLRSPVNRDADTGMQVHVIEVTVAPCLSVDSHGKDYRVAFDMESTKEFSVKFPGQLFAKSGDVAKVLHTLAASLEGVK